VSIAPEDPMYVGGVGSHPAVDTILAFVNSTHPAYYADKLADLLLRNELELDRCPIDNGLPIMRTDGRLYACFHLPESLGHIIDDIPKATAFKQPRTCYGLHCFSLFSSRFDL